MTETEKNKGGRPKKNPADVKSELLRTRFTVEEEVLLREKAAEKGLSLSSFIREAVLMRAQGKMGVSSKEIKRNARVFDNDLYDEVNRVGQNLNQIAKSSNTIPDKLPSGINRVMTELNSVVNKLKKGLSEYK